METGRAWAYCPSPARTGSCCVAAVKCCQKVHGLRGACIGHWPAPQESSAAPTRYMGRRRWPMGADMLPAMSMRPDMLLAMPIHADMMPAMPMRADIPFAIPVCADMPSAMADVCRHAVGDANASRNIVAVMKPMTESEHMTYRKLEDSTIPY